MWLLDRLRGAGASHALLHIGARALRWHVPTEGGWGDPIECVIAPEGVTRVSDLRFSLERLREVANIDPVARCRVLVDSHWAPVCWLQCGAQPFAPKSFLTLAACRLSHLHGGPPASWHVASPYLVGDQASMAFGLPEAVAATVSAAFPGQIEVDSVLHVAQKRRNKMGRREGARINHLCLLEDDRMLIQTWGQREMLGCHPCVDLPLDMEQLLSQVRKERIRLSALHGVQLPNERVSVEVYAARPPVHWQQRGGDMAVGEEHVTVRTGVSELIQGARL